MRRIDRRFFLHGLGACSGLALLPRAHFCAPGFRTNNETTLVLVQLSGGNDGLSTIVPFGDDAYHRDRPTIHHVAKDVRPIDEYRGFNSGLKRLHARFQEGGLALIEGVGYENPIRSHFRSLDVWHTADARGRASGEGWIGRLCETAFGSESRPERVVHIGRKPPYSIYSTKHPALSFALPRNYRWLEHGDQLKGLGSSKTSADSGSKQARLARMRRVMADAHASSQAVRAAIAAHQPKLHYPDDPFADSLRSAAALIHSPLETRVMSVELSGFDTHVDQKNNHQRLMRILDAALDPFLRDLEGSESGRQALVLIFSEFGRRVAENASRGTDHGCAGPMFVAGTPVKGGLFGKHPSLTKLNDGDLDYTTDFRSVYATAIRSRFGLDPKRVLGADYPLLSFV